MKEYQASTGIWSLGRLFKKKQALTVIMIAKQKSVKSKTYLS